MSATARSVCASRMISPAPASPQSRAARLGTLPIAAYSQRCSKPITPSVASPCAMPMPRPTPWPTVAQVEEYRGDVAPVRLEDFLAAGDDRFGHLPREEALQPGEPLELRDLVAHASLQLRVPAHHLVLQALHAQQRLHAREQLVPVD